jgi:cytochrome c oxidase subunit 2
MTPKTRVRQLAPAIVLAGLVLALGACGAYPNSTFNHHTDFNTDIDALWNKLLFWGTLVFVIVEGILIFTIIKFRKRPDSPPPQMTHGNTAMEISWTVLPIVILILIAIPTVKTIFKTEAPARAGSLEIEVIGHQWWWEYRYPQYGFSTANEFYLPTGRTVNFTLHTVDVIHSFWVPQMGGKRDVVGQRSNHLWYTPNADLETMVWNGFCTEYCGTSHANMRIRAYTVTPAEFESWAAGQQTPAAFGAAPPPPPPATPAVTPAASKAPPAAASKAPATAVAAAAPPRADFYVFPASKLPDYAVPKTPYPDGITYDDALLAKGDAQRGRDLFATPPKAMCITCHTLNGIPNATSLTAPNLTHIASRHTIAAGLYPNDAPHLARWIKNASKMKPGAKMNTWGTGLYDPMNKKMMGDKGTVGALTDEQIADLVAFLQTLK